MIRKIVLRSLAWTGVLLLVPLFAMIVSDQVEWTLVDFVTMGVLLFSTGVILELVAVKIKDRRYQIVLAALVLLGFLVIWAEFAVGLFD